MIEEKDSLVGVLDTKQELIGELGVGEIRIPPVLQEKTATPSTSSQTITPDSGYNGLSSVQVSAVDSSIDSNIKAENIKDGITILGTEGSYSPFQPSGEININQNGEYDITNYETANISVPGLSSLNDYAYLFANNHRLDKIQDLIDINDNTKTTYNMFYQTCQNGRGDFTGMDHVADMSNFDTSKVTNAYGMFNGTQYLCYEDFLGFENLDFSNAENMSVMLYRFGYSYGKTKNSKTVDLRNWHPKKVKNLNGFSSYFERYFSPNNSHAYTKQLTLNLSGWDVSNCTDFTACFNQSRASYIILDGWVTSKATTFNSMFAGCQYLLELDLSSFVSTPQTINAAQMFTNCKVLEKLDMRNFDFTVLTTFATMFGSVPNDCLIIVADDIQKNWFTTNWSNLTNVKTVAELEE